MKKEEGRRKHEEGRRKKEGSRKQEEGRGPASATLFSFPVVSLKTLQTNNSQTKGSK